MGGSGRLRGAGGCQRGRIKRHGPIEAPPGNSTIGNAGHYDRNVRTAQQREQAGLDRDVVSGAGVRAVVPAGDVGVGDQAGDDPGLHCRNNGVGQREPEPIPRVDAQVPVRVARHEEGAVGVGHVRDEPQGPEVLPSHRHRLRPRLTGRQGDHRHVALRPGRLTAQELHVERDRRPGRQSGGRRAGEGQRPRRRDLQRDGRGRAARDQDAWDAEAGVVWSRGE